MNPIAPKVDCNVAVIGTGPYGLAVTAHLSRTRLRIRAHLQFLHNMMWLIGDGSL
jgi:cation diffusion facilitator CzcD-associated flavoprotein CzcO